MFSKKNKIPRALFPKYTDKKNTWSGVCLRVCFYERKSSVTRFAVVVSKKQYQTIVLRNLCKRQILSALQKNKSIFFESSYEKFVIYPRGKVETINRVMINEDMKKFIKECLI